MSILETQTLPCPACGETLSFEVAHSVLADRRPDLRAAILSGRFQADACESCGAHFRREPDLNYLDIGRAQWILVRPAAEVVNWPDLEAQALGIFELGYGVLAPAPAQEIGRGLLVRVAFGWPALREKLLAREAVLDDVVLECLKLNLIRTLDAPALGDTVELRLAAADADGLSFVWIDADGETPIETMRVPREAYDQLAAATEEYKDLRARLTEGPYVDMNRLLIDPTDREVLAADAG
jgi:hypothetical protein